MTQATPARAAHQQIVKRVEAPGAFAQLAQGENRPGPESLSLDRIVEKTGLTKREAVERAVLELAEALQCNE